VRILLTYLLFLLSITAFSQPNLNGRIIDLYGDNNKFQVLLRLANSDTIVSYQRSDSLGNFEFEDIKPGNYMLTVSYSPGNGFDFEHSLGNRQNDTLVLRVPVCDSINVKGICPECQKSDAVYPIAPGMFFDTWFKRKRDERRYRRKVIRQGYELTDEENGKIVWIKDVDKEVFNDVCKHWFCIRDKTIF